MLRVEDGSVQGLGQDISPQPVPGAAQELHADTSKPSATLDGRATCSPNTVDQDETVRISLHSPIGLPTPVGLVEEEEPVQHESPWTQIGRLEGSAELPPSQPLDTAQACLLRYFIDHISPWVWLTTFNGNSIRLTVRV